jgi:hypothetical protein
MMYKLFSESILSDKIQFIRAKAQTIQEFPNPSLKAGVTVNNILRTLVLNTACNL